MLFERLTVEQFERNERSLAVPAHLVNRHHVLMFQGSGALRFAEESLQSAGLGGDVRVHQLERDVPLEVRIFRFENNRHAADAEHSQHAEVGDAAHFLRRPGRVERALEVGRRDGKSVFARLRRVVCRGSMSTRRPNPFDGQMDCPGRVGSNLAARANGFEQGIRIHARFQIAPALRAAIEMLLKRPGRRIRKLIQDQPQ